MKTSALADKSILILGLGREGQSALRYLRTAFPKKALGIADRLPLEQFSPDLQEALRRDVHGARLQLHLGPDYLASLRSYDVIVKSPGVSVIVPEYMKAVQAGKIITSPTAIFFSEFPGVIVGITGTKGKSTTSSLIHAILQKEFSDVHLVGNIGVPALDLLERSKADTIAVYELSSHQLEGLRQSPHIAVLLNIVPEHLDYYESFEQYVDAKVNIMRFQTGDDFLVYDADYEIPQRIANSSPARKAACSVEGRQRSACFLDVVLERDSADDWVAYATESHGRDLVLPVRDVPLRGKFNLRNVLAAVAVGKLLGVPSWKIHEAVAFFRPLEHRLESVGTFDGITYFNDSISTVPEATIAALDALGPDITTILLGGMDRHLDFSGLAKALLESNVKTLILFPTTGERIWQAIEQQDASASSRFQHFFVTTMEEAVALAKQHTEPQSVCLLSPASPSFGIFRDYRDRGEQFKRLVRS